MRRRIAKRTCMQLAHLHMHAGLPHLVHCMHMHAGLHHQVHECTCMQARPIRFMHTCMRACPKRHACGPAQKACMQACPISFMHAYACRPAPSGSCTQMHAGLPRHVHARICMQACPIGLILTYACGPTLACTCTHNSICGPAGLLHWMQRPLASTLGVQGVGHIHANDVCHISVICHMSYVSMTN